MIQPINRSILLWTLGGYIWLTACNTERSTAPPAPAVAEVKKSRPDFNADSAYAFVASQLAFGPRTPQSKAVADCQTWFIQILESY